MFLLRWLGMRWLMNRLTGRSAAQQRSRGGWGGYPPGWSRSQGGRAPGRGRVGMWGPFPYYSTRTRGGSSVSVGGCCLPLALGMFSAPLLAARALWRHRG